MAAVLFNSPHAEAKIVRVGATYIKAEFPRPWAGKPVTVNVPRSKFPADFPFKRGQWFHIRLRHMPIVALGPLPQGKPLFNEFLNSNPNKERKPVEPKEISQSVRLAIRNEKRDALYNLALEKQGEGWVVKIEFGRRGAHLQSAMKVKAPVPYADALKVYEATLAEKLGENYKPVEAAQAAPTQGAEPKAEKKPAPKAHAKAKKPAAKREKKVSPKLTPKRKHPGARSAKPKWELAKSAFAWPCSKCPKPIPKETKFYVRGEGQNMIARHIACHSK
jgi:hypothetical protein